MFLIFSGIELIDPSTGSCPVGRSLNEEECEAAGEFGSGWGRADTWDHETCGCFVDQNGIRYFNRHTGGCDHPDNGEKMICKTFAPPGTSLFSPLGTGRRFPDAPPLFPLVCTLPPWILPSSEHSDATQRIAEKLVQRGQGDWHWSYPSSTRKTAPDTRVVIVVSS